MVTNYGELTQYARTGQFRPIASHPSQHNMRLRLATRLFGGTTPRKVTLQKTTDPLNRQRGTESDSHPACDLQDVAALRFRKRSCLVIRRHESGNRATLSRPRERNLPQFHGVPDCAGHEAFGSIGVVIVVDCHTLSISRHFRGLDRQADTRTCHHHATDTVREADQSREPGRLLAPYSVHWPIRATTFHRPCRQIRAD